MSARRKQIAGSKLQPLVGRRNPDGTTTPMNRDGNRAGHCGHEPHCMNVGQMDDRDPLGHCSCGLRLRDAAPELLSALEALVAGVEDSVLRFLETYELRLRTDMETVLYARVERARAAIDRAKGES